MNDCLVIAHRGALNEAPQNTMPAFEKAVEIGADGVETDVHLTKDGYVVLCHNSTINGTSNGTGKISEMTLEELMKFDFGSYFKSKFSGTRIPTITEFIDYLRSTDVKVVNIEIKPSKKKDYEVVLRTIEEAKKYGIFDKLLISSFDKRAIKVAKRTDRACNTGLLYPPLGKIVRHWFIPPIIGAKLAGANAIHPQSGYVSKRVVNFAHRLGIKINVWTVNNVNKARKLIRLGVDGIITDCPQEIAKLIRDEDGRAQ